MFTGLSAFPLSPVAEESIDEPAFAGLVSRLHLAGVDSIGALGSTGSYAYLSGEQRKRIAELAVDAAEGTPVLVGIGALRTVDVLRHAEDAQNAGASAVLLAPVSYQPLTDDEVYGLYADVTARLSVPLCVYDNPGTTRFTFSDELHGRIAELPNVASVKIPATPEDQGEARARVRNLRRHVPGHVSLGVSGDSAGAGGLLAGCEAWYSVLGGLWPGVCLRITRAAQRGDADEARRLSGLLTPIWTLFGRYGSVRVVAAIADHMGLTGSLNLPRPLRELAGEERTQVEDAVRTVLPAVEN
ncbi:dihydrodipicolinate synthase family protein [Prauserella marina]|uniref:4-hydroxy-tetrahydrodipicolinate synthase n=1 Tax=Prauserella marina TaxID=530584 RepID=A0A222VP90_9PSEU|nr:dihydrodipicolinate synthase family protein [Prauserella marina]ASR35736.1 dihydrodipicolinate synthase family protein [Prauserella marina]PWV84377.1 4-hydroxy-tetrahydrodipicolinate synthase [Prauserella marina]SDC24099.1 4-hydroxy-tetrahydrodipicolinate synthase [Prauserella marina]